MADEGLSGKAWLDNYKAGNSRMLSSDWTPGYADSGKPFTANNEAYNLTFGPKPDYSKSFSFGDTSRKIDRYSVGRNVNGTPVGSGANPYAYNPDTGYGYGTAAYTPPRPTSRSSVPAPEWTQNFAKQRTFGDYSPTQQATLRDMAAARGSLQGPMTQAALRDVAGKKYTKWNPEENKAAMQRVSDLQGYNSMLGRRGAVNLLKEVGGRTINEFPLVGRLSKAAGVAGGRNLIGNKPLSRAIRTGMDLASVMGGPGFSLIGAGLAGASDLIQDKYWPNAPIAGLTGTENLQRMKLVNGQPTPVSFWEDD